MTEFFVSQGMDPNWAWFLATIAGILLIALPLMLAVAIVIYVERKLWAAFALRRGPNVVGPWGVLQSFADGLKVFLQETIIPSAANKGLFLIAPIITFTVALMAWAVIPFNSGAVLADINVGLLYVLAISSLGVYGVVIAGWASNSKYPFFSAMRAAAQMISYEVSIGFILICVVLYANSFNMNDIVEAQRGHGLGIVNGFAFNLLLFPMWVMFLISGMAETARAPFDLTEAESELVAGYQTEYSSMSFALYWLGEYANVLLMCALNAVLFFGGWLPPLELDFLYVVPGFIWLLLKIAVTFFIFGWVKATVPRYRYDQLMRLGWKVFLPLSLLFVVLVSGWLMITRYDAVSQVASGKPNVATMASLDATSVCQMRSPDNYGDDVGAPMNIYIKRDWTKPNSDQTLQIKYPERLSGTLRFTQTRSNGFGGSGDLRWVTPSRSAKFGMGVTDVIWEDGPSSILFLEDGKTTMIGDCWSKSRVERFA